MEDTSSEKILALLERLARLVANEGHAHALKPAQWEALRYLARANRFSRTPSALTSFLGLTKGTVSQTVAALENKGLVRKRPSRSDGRAVTLDVTAQGRRKLDKDPLQQMRSVIGELGGTTKRRLVSDLDRLLQARLSASDGRPFGICRECRYFERNGDGGAPHRCALLRVALSEADSKCICVEQEG